MPNPDRVTVPRSKGHTGRLLLVLGIGFVLYPATTRLLPRLDGEATASARAPITQDIWFDLSETGVPLQERKAGPVVVEFGDYQCPFCRRLHTSLVTAAAAPPRVQLRYLHLPLPVHDRALPAARAAICADQQGRFHQIHTFLYENNSWLEGEGNWLQIAEDMGVPDLAQFSSCLDSDYPDDVVARHMDLARRVGITGTPTLVSRNEQLIGWAEYADIEEFFARTLRDGPRE